MGEKYWLICVNCEYLSKFLLNLNWWPWRMMSTTTINQYRHSYHMVSPGTRDCFVHIMKMHYYLLWVVTPPDKRAVKWSVTQPSIYSIPWDNGGHLQMKMTQITTKQVCIPVGCVPSACWPYPRGICISGVYLQGWAEPHPYPGLPIGGWQTPLWTDKHLWKHYPAPNFVCGR